MILSLGWHLGGRCFKMIENLVSLKLLEAMQNTRKHNDWIT